MFTYTAVLFTSLFALVATQSSAVSCPTGTPYSNACCLGTLLTPTTSPVTVTVTASQSLPTEGTETGTGTLVLPGASDNSPQPSTNEESSGTGTLVPPPHPSPSPLPPSAIRPLPPGASLPPAVPDDLRSVLASLSSLAASLEAEASTEGRATIATAEGHAKRGRVRARQVDSTSGEALPTEVTVAMTVAATTQELAPGVTCVGILYAGGMGMAGGVGNMTMGNGTVMTMTNGTVMTKETSNTSTTATSTSAGSATVTRTTTASAAATTTTTSSAAAAAAKGGMAAVPAMLAAVVYGVL